MINGTLFLTATKLFASNHHSVGKITNFFERIPFKLLKSVIRVENHRKIRNSNSNKLKK